ncbi:MAG: hypothetical protein H0W78_08490 [Planctomycetes bacterium]|nr:hypothetical protein [Planctomycetota bacterium]
MLKQLLLSAGCLLACLPVAMSAAESTQAEGKGPNPGVFSTPVQRKDLKSDADIAWLDGKEIPVETTDRDRSLSVWTEGVPTSHHGVVYGAGSSLGVRHLRLAFVRAIPVGSVLATGNGRLSVLKADVSGLGDLGDEKQWIPAERLSERTVTSDQPDDKDALVWWVLPPGTTTRALRFSHRPTATDSDFSGRLGGLYVVEKRYANVAPQGRVVASDNDKVSERLIDSVEQSWGAWSNGDNGGDDVVSSAHPVDIALAFPGPVAISGLSAWFSGADSAEIAIEPASLAGQMPDLRDAGWKTIHTVVGMHNWYPCTMKASWIDLQKNHEAGALRLRMIKPADPNKLHPHTKGNPKEGRRVWLDELLALVALGDRPLSSAILPEWPSVDAHPPIAVPFHLNRPGNVTLVIEKSDGTRVRNLIANKPYPAGDQTAWWDGLDDLGRDADAAAHGLYHVPGSMVEAATYRVRGLSHPEIELHYELSPDNAGEPPWPTPDNTGGWGTNHTPPSCVAIVPADRNSYGEPLVFIGSYVAEGGHGLFWVGLDGKKKGGVHWLGGHWTGAQTLAVDVGNKPLADTAIYVASGFEGEVRFVSLTKNLNEKILAKVRVETSDKAPTGTGKAEAVRVTGKGDAKPLAWVGDLAARDGVIVASLPRLGEVWLVDAGLGRLIGRIALDKPSGVAFSADGSVLVTNGNQVVRLTLDAKVLDAARADKDEAELLKLAPGKTVLAGLDQPSHLSLDSAGNFIVSERGKLHQVRIYSPSGKMIRAIGKPGQPAAGPYDPQHCNNPAGVAVDPQGRFWVTEEHTQPKRVSLWSPTGTLVNAWYGPSRYGGGGTLDAYDRNLFHNAGMTFRVDWKKGDISVERVLLQTREHAEQNGEHPQFPIDGHAADGMPEFAYKVDGRRFFSNWHNSNPTNGASLAVVWEDAKGVLSAVAAIGSPWGWSLLKEPAFTACWPANTNEKKKHEHPLWFTWVDGNSDGRVDPNEITIRPGRNGGITVQRDLAFVVRIDNRILRFPATVGKGPVRYDFGQPEVLMEGAQNSVSSGGDVYLLTADKQVFAYPPCKPWSPYSVGGGPVGKSLWSYPNMWPGLHPSHEAAVPDQPGQLIGPTRLIGLDVTPRSGDAGPLVFLNENMGTIAVMSSDGLFVTTLFHDSRVATRWRMPVRTRDMRVDQISLGDETFWPTVTQVEADGSIYLCTGAASTSSLVRVDGLEKITRFPKRDLVVDKAQLAACLDWQSQRELERQKLTAPKRVTVALAQAAPVVDGKLDDWSGADWAMIDDRGTRANFNSNSKPYQVEATLRIVGDTVYAAWRSSEKNLTENTGEQATAPFKTGAALDLMLGTDATAKPDRAAPVAGDVRLLITQRGKDKDRRSWAVLYRAVVPGTATDAKVPFSSPWRTITFDVVSDVSDQIKLAQNDGDYEVAIPLTALGWKPIAGKTYRGDLGVLRGQDGLTTQRVYWSNKATGITADVPSEAMLQPSLWGTFEVK